MSVTRAHNWVVFDEGEGRRYQMADPDTEAMAEAAHAARYNLAHMTQTQAFLLCQAFESYHHLCTHPMGTERAVVKLRRLRKAIREVKP